MAGIRDVARAAGVSVSTVSQVLNNPEFGKPQTRQRVFAAAEKLNYRPNAIARSLVRQRADTLGLVIPDLLNPVFPTVADAVERTARAAGYSLVLGTTSREPAAERQYRQLFMQNKADGVIFFAALDESNIQALLRRHVPVVLIERPMSVPGVDLVGVDNRLGGYLATRHLLEQVAATAAASPAQPLQAQSPPVAMIVGPLGGEVEQQRLAGYQRALLEAGLSGGADGKSLVVEAWDHVEEAGRQAMAELLYRLRQRGRLGHTRPEGQGQVVPLGQLHSSPPLAGVFVASDILAVGALRQLEAEGIRVPDDVLIVGFDNTLSRYTSPPLSTVAQPFVRMGETAVHLLLERISDPGRPPSQVLLEPALIIRQSSQPSTIWPTSKP
ncbi:MAG: LacI family DNA-binding transcriptional regulator [Limnochordaceae bacterium]|nr:LacI family DNA-binding transcriptional regulator [Limnochordaceae bacterium]